MDNSDYSTSIYAKAIRETLPRVLSMLDREAFSKTFGCADRVFWSWKFTDFPGSRFQEGVYSLAYLFTTPLPDNCYAKDQRVLEWIRAGLGFWARRQRRDGSFDEAYPFEHSLAATAFGSLAMRCLPMNPDAPET